MIIMIADSYYYDDYLFRVVGPWNEGGGFVPRPTVEGTKWTLQRGE